MACSVCNPDPTIFHEILNHPAYLVPVHKYYLLHYHLHVILVLHQAFHAHQVLLSPLSFPSHQTLQKPHQTR